MTFAEPNVPIVVQMVISIQSMMLRYLQLDLRKETSLILLRDQCWK